MINIFPTTKEAKSFRKTQSRLLHKAFALKDESRGFVQVDQAIVLKYVQENTQEMNLVKKFALNFNHSWILVTSLNIHIKLLSSFSRHDELTISVIIYIIYQK